MDEYNEKRTRQGKCCQERTTMDTFRDGIKLFREKNLSEMAAA
ncbi:hypothetical cytosolic protein [Syntrophus aciditrophicus SB]|uniref:Hypothetical cytosolic protein n=1 Tax=Syntrophus aciditrophicus (strain SB) TaxID=56780 RepID=Q2LRU6_SYNAS|nr:hypothetical cytosolic protein [Syntrophus aciditrophicus SB]